MRRTLNELVLEMPYSSNIEENQNNILKLLKLVRQKTLEECAKVCNELQDTSTFSGWIDESLFLELPKDSILTKDEESN